MLGKIHSENWAGQAGIGLLSQRVSGCIPHCLRNLARIPAEG